MPRDGGGSWFPTPGNPVVPGTTITAEWANPTVTDFGNEVTDSLSRSGKGGMQAPLRGPNGSVALPTYSFTSEPSTGRYREGPGQVVEAVDGNRVMKYDASGVYQWEGDQNTGSWVPLTPRDALGTPFDPAPTTLTSTNVQDAIEEVYSQTGGIITADSVSYDDSTVYFPATTVQIAIDRIGADIPDLAQDILDNADAIQLIGGPGGDIDLLTQRVGQNEINIGNNTTDIALHETRLDQHDIDINGLLGDVGSIKLEQITQNSDIQQNSDNIVFNYNITQTNADDIADNVDAISTNASAITGNTNAINQNVADIGFVFDITQDNADDIVINSDAITANTGRIAQNEADLQAFNGIFPGGVLQVTSGGTGVQTKTGTGSVVLSTAPTLSAAYLTGSSFADTPSPGDNSTRVATTAFVQAEGNTSNCYMATGGNANGEYYAIRDVIGGGDWRVVQWGRASMATDPGTTVSFPLGYSNTATEIVVMPHSAGTSGNDNAPGLKAISTGSFRCVWVGGQCGWIAVGTLNYSAAFVAIPLSGDRYYHKVLKTEWIEQIHGPWTSDPNVVVLPPANTFWQGTLDVDEELTYDIDDLPLARVARVKPPGEIIVALLLAAGLTGTEFRRALLADSRGIPADLVAFNAALDVLIAANPYTEAQFLEVL